MGIITFTNQNILKANKFRCRCEERIVACSAYILKKIMENSEIYPVFQYAIGKGEKSSIIQNDRKE